MASPNLNEPCLIKNCPKLSRCRGLCLSHYHLARNRIVQGLVTEKDLVKQKKMKRVLAKKYSNHPSWHKEKECVMCHEKFVSRQTNQVSCSTKCANKRLWLRVKPVSFFPEFAVNQHKEK